MTQDKSSSKFVTSVIISSVVITALVSEVYQRWADMWTFEQIVSSSVVAILILLVIIMFINWRRVGK
jgi:hypothetical protein